MEARALHLKMKAAYLAAKEDGNKRRGSLLKQMSLIQDSNDEETATPNSPGRRNKQENNNFSNAADTQRVASREFGRDLFSRDGRLPKEETT